MRLKNLKKRILNLIKILLAFIKRHRCNGWTSKFEECQSSKGKNINKLWQKLSNISINTGLDLKIRFVWKKKKHITISEISSTLVGYSSKCRVVQYVKSVQIRSFFSPYSVRMQKIQTRKNSVFGHFSHCGIFLKWPFSRRFRWFSFRDVYSSLDERISMYLDPCP